MTDNEKNSHEKTGNDLAALAASQARRVMEKIPLLGAVGWLMMQQPGLRHTLLSELEWRVMPALVLDQAKLYMRDGAPIGYASWAMLSEPVAQRYQLAPHHLMAADWRSGEQAWLVDLVCPFGGMQEVLRDLREGVLAGMELRQLSADGQGGVTATTWPACPARST